MSSSIQGISSRFLELQQTADRLASLEDPSPDEIQLLYDTVVELSRQGATQAEVTLLNRDIAAIEEDGGEEDSAEDVACAAAPPSETPAAPKGKHRHHRRHGLKKLAHKIGKFVRKHKKELIIGAVVATAIGITAAVGVAGGAASVRRKKREDDRRAIGSSPPESSIGGSLGRGFDREAVLRSEGIRAAEIKAKEQRYPGLVHPEESMRLAQQRATAALDRFKERFGHSIGSKEITEAVGIGLILRDAAVSVVSSPAVAALQVGFATLMAKDMVNDYGHKVVHEFYQPAREAYMHLHQMQEANNQASLDRCIAEGYQPRLEFHPETPDSGIDRSILVDRNNPNPNAITVVLP